MLFKFRLFYFILFYFKLFFIVIYYYIKCQQGKINKKSNLFEIQF
jgi:hypothetical protein